MKYFAEIVIDIPEIVECPSSNWEVTVTKKKILDFYFSQNKTTGISYAYENEVRQIWQEK